MAPGAQTGKEYAFSQFDAVTDCSDHHYLESNLAENNSNCFTNARSDVHKKIMREWKILQKDLPESIYVRVVESRIDLLRAVIIGAPKTPYHDGLYFFDIAFPPNYPTSPPLVHYRSRGIRLNPNLYSNGTVCLSLLNTWFGAEEERWTPSKSTILQVLISLQGLVLNERPYYNEPGLKPARSWKSYNRKVFLLSCQTMLYVVRSPPKNFKDFVIWHFRQRAGTILRACRFYRDGYGEIGSYADSVSSSKREVKVKRKFKKQMDRLYTKLFLAFHDVGASLSDLPACLASHDNKKEKEVKICQKIASTFNRCLEHVGLKKAGKDKKNQVSGKEAAT